MGYEQVAKRIANIRLTCKCRAESRISCADHKGYRTARMNWENRVKESLCVRIVVSER